MSAEMSVTNRIKACRVARGWSQDDLAAKAGISRAGVSAIETQRLVPSTAAALALAAALECGVEDLFQLGARQDRGPVWAWQPKLEPCRFWCATVGGHELLYPAEATDLGVIGHDGVYNLGKPRESAAAEPSDTLVVASCDPAIALLASHYSRRSGFRMIAFQRSSREALALLAKGLVHAAGVHFALPGQPNHNVKESREHLPGAFRLLRLARWQEGLAMAPQLQLRSVGAAVRSRGRWIGREVGSAARELLDELLANRRGPRHVAYGHRGVAEAVRSGLADFGVCLRLVGEELGLGFLAVRQEDYDLCIPAAFDGDPRIKSLVETVRSAEYRSAIADLPGYDSSRTGELEEIPLARFQAD
jgi:molybdate-binding protein/DNA-binding XRE family transcriptional regulator